MVSRSMDTGRLSSNSKRKRGSGGIWIGRGYGLAFFGLEFGEENIPMLSSRDIFGIRPSRS